MLILSKTAGKNIEYMEYMAYMPWLGERGYVCNPEVDEIL